MLFRHLTYLLRLLAADVGTEAAAKPKARREKKEAFKIDFLAPLNQDKDLKEIQKDLFAPVTKGAGINLPGTSTAAKKSRKKTKEKEKRDDHRLPDDMHFSSKQLVTLFLKPKFVVRSMSFPSCLYSLIFFPS